MRAPVVSLQNVGLITEKPCRERERERLLPHKKRVQCCTEAGVEREREGLVERERDAQALGAWGEKHPRRTSSHSLFSPQTNPKKIR